MRSLVRLNVDEVTPTPAEVIESQGMAGRTNLPARIHALLDSALELFQQLVEPQGLMQDFPVRDFGSIYDGNGLNSPEGPVPAIVMQAHKLALFAASLGNALIAKSSELFTKGGPALGYMLDAVNSSGTEKMGKIMGQRFLDLMPAAQRQSRDLKVQYYSPGHCGWHISGQARLFDILRPEVIGISLNESWAMQPVKSISGILVVGDMKIHRFQPAFSFCKQCKEHKCLKRLKDLESGD